MICGLLEWINLRTGASEGTRRQLVDVVAQEVSLGHVYLGNTHKVRVDAPTTMSSG